jgi:hypothetical protein
MTRIIGRIVVASLLATTVLFMMTSTAGASTSHQTGRCTGGDSTSVTGTATYHIHHDDSLYSGTASLLLSNGNRIHYYVDYTVVSAHEWTGTMVVQSTEISNTWYYIDGSAFFADNSSYASYSGTEYDLCAVLGGYPPPS